jgi:predicted dehydrogenase
VSYEEATFTVIGAIGLQGIRLANPTLGETVVVSGLGLIGLITAELLMANGCTVIGFDFDARKTALAREKGILAYNLSGGTDPVKTVTELTGGTGADAVIITASTKSDEVISQSAQMSRKRGRIILVGVVGLDIKRADFYEKELSFQVSCSYGPGRYDDDYEKRGIEYPLPFVRWTENRNFQTVLQAIATGKLDVKRLITEEVPLEEYQKIYGNIGGSNSIASILKYKETVNLHTSVSLAEKPRTFSRPGKSVIAIVGAGNFTKMTMLPVLSKIGADIKYIVSAAGVSGTHLARKHHIPVSSTSYTDVLQDKEVGSVIITTQHNLHASMIIQALQAGKHVFVEKPLVLSPEELQQVIEVYIHQANTSVTVGFNRRFSPFIQKAKALLGPSPEPLNMVITVNAGFIAASHWTQHMAVGGGRIIGEACHFIDLAAYLAGSEITGVVASALGNHPARNADNVSVIIRCKNGSQCVVNYFSNGHKAYAKERIEVYSLGRVLILDNFRKLEGYGFKGFSSMSGKQDKGHKNQFEAYTGFLQKGGEPIIPFTQIVNTTKATFAAVEAFTSGQRIDLE